MHGGDNHIHTVRKCKCCCRQTVDKASLYGVSALDSRNDHRVGEEIEGRIINVNENFPNEYSATTIEQKELVLEDDKKTIMEYIDTHFGVIPFSENSDPEVIERVFKMSKSAFKRAIGSLYKDKLIIIEENRIISSKLINWSNSFKK